jgi:hypothetical protein
MEKQGSEQLVENDHNVYPQWGTPEKPYLSANAFLTQDQFDLEANNVRGRRAGRSADPHPDAYKPYPFEWLANLLGIKD